MTQMAAVAIVRSTAAGSGEARDALVSAGALPLLTEMLKAEGKASLQWLAAAALADIAEDNDTRRDAVVKAGALEQLQEMLWSPMPETKSQASAALEKITRGSEELLGKVELEAKAESDTQEVQFGEAAYWDKRYETEEHYEWIVGYAELKDIIVRVCASKSARILNLGCGTSRISEDMYDDGYTNIVNTDISETVINKMRARNVDRPGMEWLVEDALDMAGLADGTFDLVLDKSTLDALAHTQKAAVLAKLMGESCRVLKPEGTYLQITVNQHNPNYLRMPHLDFDIETLPLKGLRLDKTYVSICRKQPGADDVRRDRQPGFLEWAKSFDMRMPGVLEMVARNNRWEQM